ncbi:mRNA-decapping enzyme subunit 2 [Coemansia sp. RSA 1358]|nr:mRNA-decapping enzyme subunit 2 [Coemansia umbellata]KAJ2621915.1 mRNA-decapping enzyme subunit 2 [Coemansia sp. RSA 1358]
MFEDASFDEILDDLASRFIINVPEEELQEIERICFQIEQAHWFYDDFVREKNPSLPSMTLKTFAGRMFRHCPLLSQWAHDSEAAYQTFLEYKFKVPVCGAIILNPNLDKVLLVKGWSSRSSWGFPRGKINKDEPEWQCAQREVIEETGFDILPYLIEKQRIEITQANQNVLLYIITGIPEDTVFMPTTRKEISQVQWHNIADLPCAGRTDRNGGSYPMSSKSNAEKEHRYYLIKPFIKRIKAWAAKHPEKVGIPAVVVNRNGKPPAGACQYSASGDGGTSGSDHMANSLGINVARISSGPNVISVQDLFNAVNKSKTGNRANIAGTPPPPSTKVGSITNTDGGSASSGSAALLQTLMGGKADSSNSGSAKDEDGKLAALSNLMRRRGISSKTPLDDEFAAINNKSASTNGAPAGQSALSGFSFDAQAIMNAYGNSNT